MTTTSWARVVTTSILVLGLIVTSALAEDNPVELVQAQTEVPEELLLDVGIQIFDPGLPDDEYERYMLEERGVFADVRKSEARYFPLRSSKLWRLRGFGARFASCHPLTSSTFVSAAAIWKSNGKKLEVDIKVVDATGKEWLDKRYKDEANPMAYKDKETDREPFPRPLQRDRERSSRGEP